LSLENLNESQITDWLKNKIKKKIDRIKVNGIRPGKFYAFNYDSKLFQDEKLKFYDENPLVLILSQGHMLGLNFHYLPTKIRERVIKRLKNRYKKQWSANKILPNVSWNDLKSELKYADFMVKLYIRDNVRHAVKIEHGDMEKLVKVRSEQFIGIRPETLWKSMGLK
jgi:hypothetical protein